MPTRNVVLTEHHEKLLERLVSSGRYQNASEVLREGLRLIERQEADDQTKLQALREAAAVGIADLEAGRSHRFESYEEMEAYLTAITDPVINGKQD